MTPDLTDGAPPAAASARDEEKRKRESGRILIVEDDYFAAMEIETALSEAGFEIIGIASTSEEAIKLAKAEAPTLAIMDIRLAGRRDGVDAALEIFRETGVRCIFATAHHDERVRARAQPAAPLGWLAKPYTSHSLVAMVQHALIEL